MVSPTPSPRTSPEKSRARDGFGQNGRPGARATGKSNRLRRRGASYGLAARRTAFARGLGDRRRISWHVRGSAIRVDRATASLGDGAPRARRRARRNRPSLRAVDELRVALRAHGRAQSTAQVSSSPSSFPMARSQRRNRVEGGGDQTSRRRAVSPHAFLGVSPRSSPGAPAPSRVGGGPRDVAPNALRFASRRSPARSCRPRFGRREPTHRSSVAGGPRRTRAAAPMRPRRRASRPPTRAPARTACGAARSREAAPRPRPHPRPAGRSSVATGPRRATRAIAKRARRRETSRAPRRAPAREARPHGAARKVTRPRCRRPRGSRRRRRHRSRIQRRRRRRLRPRASRRPS